MISGRWGKPGEVLLDLFVAPDGSVGGLANPGRENAPIRRGHFDQATSAVELEGEHITPEGATLPFRIRGSLDGRTLRLAYVFGERTGEIAVVRVEEYVPPRLTLWQRAEPWLAAVKRWINARSRPSHERNDRRLRRRGESLDTITLRDATFVDIPALAELHVTTWNATYRTSRGPTVATRTWQWKQVFAKENRRDFVVVLVDRDGRLVGFICGRPREGEFTGELSKIFLRWEYHRLGLGRLMMQEAARQFLDRGISSFILFADLGNPTLGFYDHLGGERLLDEHGRFAGAYAWRDVHTLLGQAFR